MIMYEKYLCVCVCCAKSKQIWCVLLGYNGVYRLGLLLLLSSAVKHVRKNYTHIFY